MAPRVLYFFRLGREFPAAIENVDRARSTGSGLHGEPGFFVPVFAPVHDQFPRFYFGPDIRDAASPDFIGPDFCAERYPLRDRVVSDIHTLKEGSYNRLGAWGSSVLPNSTFVLV